MKSKIKLFLTTCLLAVAFAIPITTVHADTDTQQILEEYYEEFKNEYASFYQGKGGGNDVSARAIFTSDEDARLFADLLSKHLK